MQPGFSLLSVEGNIYNQCHLQPRTSKDCHLPREAGHQPGVALRGSFRVNGAWPIFSCRTPRPVGPQVSASFRDTACGTVFQPPSESHTTPSSFPPHLSCLLLFPPGHSQGPPSLCECAVTQGWPSQQQSHTWFKRTWGPGDQELLTFSERP